MNNYFLTNHLPLPFNFLLFINRIYSNKPSTELSSFPNPPFFQNGLLTLDVFNERLSEIWKLYISEYQDLMSRSQLEQHRFEIQFTTHHQHFLKLFNDNENGIQSFRLVWNIFISWWWMPSCGLKETLEIVSDEFLAELPMIKLNKNLSIQVVFDELPSFLTEKGSNFLITPIKDLESILGKQKVLSELENL